jgi:hypothetical protein
MISVTNASTGSATMHSVISIARFQVGNGRLRLDWFTVRLASTRIEETSSAVRDLVF